MAASIRLTHPEMAPEEMTAGMGLEPRGSWRAGEKNVTGHERAQSYWHLRLDIAAEASLEEGLEEALRVLWPRREFLKLLREGGGEVTVYASWWLGNGAIVPPELMAGLAACGATLMVDLQGRQAPTPFADSDWGRAKMPEGMRLE